MKTRRGLLLALVAFVAFASSGCGYNTLTAKQQNVRRSWADVESQLQRRADLVPNLVAAAQSAGIQEQEVFGQIAEARSRLINATGARVRARAATRRPSRGRPSSTRPTASAGRSAGCSPCRRATRSFVQTSCS